MIVPFGVDDRSSRRSTSASSRHPLRSRWPIPVQEVRHFLSDSFESVSVVINKDVELHAVVFEPEAVFGKGLLTKLRGDDRPLDSRQEGLAGCKPPSQWCSKRFARGSRIRCSFWNVAAMQTMAAK